MTKKAGRAACPPRDAIATPKGFRTIDFVLSPDRTLMAGMGENLGGRSRAELLDAYGRVDQQQVAAELNNLHIGADPIDCMHLCYDLDGMRITNHRESGLLEEVLLLVDALAPKIAPVIEDISQNEQFIDRPLNRRMAVDLAEALAGLLQSVSGVQRTRIWERNQQDWRDDAILIAGYLQAIAKRENASERLSFKSGDGPTTRFIALMLNLGGVKRQVKGKLQGELRGITITPDAVRKALKDHPRARDAGLD